MSKYIHQNLEDGWFARKRSLGATWVTVIQTGIEALEGNSEALAGGTALSIGLKLQEILEPDEIEYLLKSLKKEKNGKSA